MSEINRLSNGRPFKCPECGSMFCQDYSCMPRHGTGTLPTPPEGVGICEDCIHKTICSQYNGAPRSVLQCMTSCPDHLKASEVKPSPAPKTGEGVDDLRYYLWWNHGCSSDVFYGDDGEMQCSKCGIDFKRGDMKAIIQSLIRQAGDRRVEELFSMCKDSPMVQEYLRDKIDTLKGESK